MLYKHSKHMSGRYKKSAHHFVWILCLWVHFLPQVDGYFMSDAKAVLQGCEDHWTFQPQGHRIPVLFQMTVCVDIQVLSLGEWTAFSYFSAPAPRYELALQGDENSLYAWLLGVRHQFPVQLTLRRWYRLCLRWDAPHKSFSLTIGGSSEVYQRTAIARAIPPSGQLLLGCQPKDVPPGVNMATVELYLFRIWDNVGEHRACEDGTVVGWDSRLWTITRAQARIQDYKLQCGLGHLRMKRNAHGSTTPSNTSQGVAAGRDFSLTSPSPLYSTLNSIITNAQKLTQGPATNPSGSMSVTTTTLPHQSQVSSTTSASTRTISNSSYSSIPNIITTRPAGLSTHTTPSVNLTTPTKAPLIVITTSSATITSSPQALISSAITTTNASHTGGLKISVQPTSEITANHTAASSPAAPTIMSQAANQTAVLLTNTSNVLFTDPFVVQCNFSQYCANESSYYWMLVEVHGSNMTEKDIQIWFSDHFNRNICSAGISITEVNNTTCQSSMVYVTAEVTCQAKENIERTNCTVLLQLSQPVNKCILRRLVENAGGDPSIQIYLMGDIERVGKGLCEEHNISPAGDGIVHCTSPMSYNDICQTLGAVNVTCSYVEKDFVPNDFNVVYNQSCNVESQQHCECHVSYNNKTYYALRLNITKPDVNFTSIQNTVLQLSTPCKKSSIPGSLCNTFSEVSQFYQGMHLECYGEEKRLYTCMLALQMSKQLDVCTVSTVMAGLWKDSTSVSFDGPLTRIAICRLSTDSETILFNSTFTWAFVDRSASQINSITDQLTCEQGHTFAVLLNESCAVSPSESYTTPPVPHSTENSATYPNITSPSFTTDWMLSNQTSTTGRLQNTSKTPLNTTVSISNISFMSINSTVTQTSTTNHTQLDPTVTTLNATDTMLNTTVTPPIITIPLVNTTVTPLNPTVTTFNTADALLNTTVLTLNITTPLVNTTTISLNTTITPSMSLLNSISMPDRPFNTTVTTESSPFTALNTTVALHHTTVTPFNTTVTPLLSIFTTQINSTGPENTTISKDSAFTYLNTTTSIQNSTQLSLLNTTEYSTQTLQNTAELSTTAIKNNIVALSTRTTQANTTVSTINVTESNTTQTFQNITDLSKEAIPFNTTFYTMAPSDNTIQANTTALAINLKESNTTQPLENTTEFITTLITYNSTQLLNSSTLETSGAETTTTELTTTVNTTMYTPNFKALNTSTDIPDLMHPNVTSPLFNTTQNNAADFPMNTTLFNTMETPVNLTTHNKSDTNNIINITETSNSTSELNTTANPVIDTTQFNTTNTMQIHTTTFPATENITSGHITTVSRLNTTQLNTTLEKASTDNTTMNTTTTINPINIQHNTTITSIVTNNSAAPTTAVPDMHPGSPQSSYNSTAASPIVPQITQTTSRGNTLGTTARPTVPATSAITTAITSVIATTKTPGSVATDLLNQTKDAKNLNSSEVNKLVSQLENLLSAPNISKDLGTIVLSVINNILNFSSDSLANSSNRLIKAVDSLGLKLLIQNQTESIAFESLSLAVTKVDGTNFGTTSFSMANPLKPEVTKEFQTEIRAVESSSPLGKITLPASLTENLSPEEQKIASRVQFTFFQKSTFFQDQALTQQTLNSHILGSSVANLSISNLRENVEFILKNKQPVVGKGVASCVFWDFGINDGLGGWSSSGCFVKNTSTQNETVCSCNHLTSFAVLLDVSRQGVTDRLQATILTFITFIGCGVSAIFLSVTLLTYLAFDKIRRDIPSKILIHLCFGLLLLNLVFLLDSWLALYPNAVGLCISTAFFLHYFLLVSFTWMGLESLHMYLSIVKVFNNYMSRYMLKFSLTGWGVPLIVVIIVIAVNKDNYGLLSYGKYSDGTTDDFCWLKNDIAFYVAVVAYFCIIFMLNVAMFVVVMVHLRRIKRQNPHNNQYRSGLHELRSIAGLTFLLGLTWGFAFFAWGPVNLAFMYLFSIFNSLQGFFIFLFHCALKENVRKQWRMYLCCGRLRLAENSEWSRTATQNNTKKTSILTTNSSNLGRESAQRSSVSSDESIPSNGIGSPIADNLIMSEETTDDVVLNEMNSQLRPRIRSV